ncbi:MAG: molybdopterin-dependent oxidoreductase [Georgfuchsia sp.]
MKTVHTCCQICEQMCGLSAQVDNGKVVRIDPDKENTHNWRDYCVKGALSYLALDHPKRIRRPMKRVGERYVETSYEEAIADIGARLGAIIERHGPDAVGAYLGNPGGFSFGAVSFFSMLANAIDTRNKFYTGSIDQNALNVVFEKMFGNGWIALQRDVDACKCFLLIGTNPAISAFNFQGHVPDGWHRVLAAKKAGAELIVVDPRRTETAAKATLHVAPLPETDWAFVLAVIHIIFARGWENRERFHFSNGIEAVRDIALAARPEELALRCDVPLATIERVAEIFTKAPSAMAVAATGAGQGRNGTLTIWLSTVLNLITNRIEAPGGLFYAEDAVLNLIEVSGDLVPDVPRVSRVRGSKSIMGYLPIAEIPDEINTPGEGQIRAMLIHGGNPVITGPDGKALAAALDRLDLLVCCDLFQRESHRNADWLIPAVHMLEREELPLLIHSLNPAAWAQFSRQVVPPPEGLRPEWTFYRDLGLAMNLPRMKGKKDFSPHMLAEILMKKSKSLKWEDVVNAEHGAGTPDKPVQFGSLFRLLKTPDGKVAAAPPEFLELLRQRLREPLQRPSSGEYPLQLITRRSMYLMNSWSHETSVTNLKQPLGDTVELNAADAARLGVADGQQVRVISATSEVSARATLSDAVRSGVAVMAHGWGGKTYDPLHGGFSENGGVNRNLLVSNRDVDPLSFVPRLNGCEVRIEAASIH